MGKDDYKPLVADGKIAGNMGPSSTVVGNDQIYFGVTVNRQRAEYLARCLEEPLCSDCGRELAECDADPCPMMAPRSHQVRRAFYPNRAVMNKLYVLAVEADGNRCPNCSSDEIEGGVTQIEGTEAWQPCHCLSCATSWRDKFRLVGFDQLTKI